MERNGIGYISPRFSASDFLNLHIDEFSSWDEWDYAIEIFRDRIESRYLEPIAKLLETKEDIEKNGFAVMALECLLVDTFYQFRDPENIYEVTRYQERYRRPNRIVYSDFLVKYFPEDFDRNKAYLFYKDIRCGILHSAQTKHGSQLTYNKDYVVSLFDENRIRVDINNFSNRMHRYYDEYVMGLESGDIQKRLTFIKQMNKICRL